MKSIVKGACLLALVIPVAGLAAGPGLLRGELEAPRGPAAKVEGDEIPAAEEGRAGERQGGNNEDDLLVLELLRNFYPDIRQAGVMHFDVMVFPEFPGKVHNITDQPHPVLTF